MCAHITQHNHMTKKQQSQDINNNDSVPSLERRRAIGTVLVGVPSLLVSPELHSTPSWAGATNTLPGGAAPPSINIWRST
jgi:hypothetical protein